MSTCGLRIQVQLLALRAMKITSVDAVETPEAIAAHLFVNTMVVIRFSMTIVP